jgi:dipeptidase
MCDTLWIHQAGGSIFAKNSDRPVAEPQVIEACPAREPGGTLGTQYLSIPDTGACAVVLSRPTWLWGVEHGLNEHRVAIGNEKVYTIHDPYSFPPALIGMDLVRLGLERSTSAEDALAVITDLIAVHGQGGIADQSSREPYWSSFLVADPGNCFVLETSARTWAARRVGVDETGVAISNRITLGSDWTLSSDDLPEGADFDGWRNQEAPTGHADRRLSASRDFVASRDPMSAPDPAAVAAHMRDHGSGPWGSPSSPSAEVVPPPEYALPDGTGVSVCMHVAGYQATAASMISWLPRDQGEPVRAWFAQGNPCASVFLPTLPDLGVPEVLSDEEVWWRFHVLARAVENDPALLGAIREIFGPLESALWQEAESLPVETQAWSSFYEYCSERLRAALAKARMLLPV